MANRRALKTAQTAAVRPDRVHGQATFRHGRGREPVGISPRPGLGDQDHKCVGKPDSLARDETTRLGSRHVGTTSFAEEPIVRPVVTGRVRELAFHCDEELAAGPRRKAADREVLTTARAGGQSRRPIGKARFASPLGRRPSGPRPAFPPKRLGTPPPRSFAALAFRLPGVRLRFFP